MMAIFYSPKTHKLLPHEIIIFGYIFLWTFTTSLVNVWVHVVSLSYYLNKGGVPEKNLYECLKVNADDRRYE